MNWLPWLIGGGVILLLMQGGGGAAPLANITWTQLMGGDYRGVSGLYKIHLTRETDAWHWVVYEGEVVRGVSGWYRSVDKAKRGAAEFIGRGLKF